MTYRTTPKELAGIHKDTTDKCYSILVRKNHDYSGDNGDALANFREAEAEGVDAMTGVMLRIRDKLSRIRTFIKKGRLQVANESVEDAIDDTINYLVIMKALIREKIIEEENSGTPRTRTDQNSLEPSRLPDFQENLRQTGRGDFEDRRVPRDG